MSESVDPDVAHEALDQTITVTTTNLVVSGSPGSGKTSVVSLSVGEPAPTVRNSTGCVEKPVRAIAHGAMHARGTKLQKLETKAFLRMINQAMRHEIEKTMRSIHASHVATTSGDPPLHKQQQQEEVQQEAEHSEPAGEEDIMVFAKLLEKIFSSDSSPDFLTAHLVLTIDSGGQPNFMDAARLFLRNNSLYLLTIKLNERLDEKPKFDFYINGKPISMCNTAIQLTNLQLVECLAAGPASTRPAGLVPTVRCSELSLVTVQISSITLLSIYLSVHCILRLSEHDNYSSVEYQISIFEHFSVSFRPLHRAPWMLACLSLLSKQKL